MFHALSVSLGGALYVLAGAHRLSVTGGCPVSKICRAFRVRSHRMHTTADCMTGVLQRGGVTCGLRLQAAGAAGVTA